MLALPALRNFMPPIIFTMFRTLLSAAFLCVFCMPAIAGNSKLVAGPMQGHTTATASKVWVLVKNAHSVSVAMINIENNAVVSIQQTTEGLRSYKGITPMTFNFVALSPEQQYKVEIVMDGDTVRPDNVLKTFSNDPNKPYSFLVGSCAYLPPIGVRWMQPGIEERIYPHMIKTGGDFMLWTGDYLYFWKWHYKSWEGMMRKYISTRSHKKMERFVESCPQYSMWDDHDYGPNDAGGHWGGEENAFDVFKRFWPNPSYGTDSLWGNYTSFKYQDSEFFLTDDRSFRTEPDVKEPSFLGDKQMKLLQSQLLDSKATFKFIAIGNQVLNKLNHKECFQHYTNEVDELTNFIYNNHITGVIFLTGDMHYSELIKAERKDGYPLYDFTCSGITSFRYKVTKHGQKENPQRVPGKIYEEQNYGKISVTGTAGNKVCLLEVFNNRGKLKWSHAIPEKELQFSASSSNEKLVVPVKN
jgi:alkaline phosphatase D